MISRDVKFHRVFGGLFLTAIFCLTGGFVFAQNSAEQALVKEDLPSITAQFADKLEMCVPGKQGSYTKADAGRMLNEFFDAYVVKTYKPMHSGSSKDKDSDYSIGELSTDKGAFRVYIYYDESGGKRLIKELCIEK